MKKFALLLAILVLAGSLWNLRIAGMKEAPIDYKSEMVQLISNLRAYSKSKKQDFLLLGNGGVNIYYAADAADKESVAAMLSNVDGIMTESLFYGWDMEENKPTPKEESAWTLQALSAPREALLPIFNIDYCNSKAVIAKADKKNQQQEITAFMAADYSLTTIPDTAIAHENLQPVNDLKAVKNFLILLNPEKFPDKESYLKALQQNNYDLLIIDSEYDGKVLEPADVAGLQQKADGSRRLVIAYLSIGEAEIYRSYWQASWNEKKPAWIAEANSDWSDNYKVKYWTQEWQDILYGKRDSCLDKIITAGFDGAFLDVIDAFEYYQ